MRTKTKTGERTYSTHNMLASSKETYSKGSVLSSQHLSPSTLLLWTEAVPRGTAYINTFITLKKDARTHYYLLHDKDDRFGSVTHYCCFCSHSIHTQSAKKHYSTSSLSHMLGLLRRVLLEATSLIYTACNVLHMAQKETRDIPTPHFIVFAPEIRIVTKSKTLT